MTAGTACAQQEAVRITELVSPTGRNDRRMLAHLAGLPIKASSDASRACMQPVSGWRQTEKKRPSGTKQSQPNSRTSQPCTRLQWKRSRPTIRNPPASRESAKPTKSEPAENKTAGDSKASKPPISSRTGPRPQPASREALQSSPPRTRLRENQGEPRRGPESLDT